MALLPFLAGGATRRPRRRCRNNRLHICTLCLCPRLPLLPQRKGHPTCRGAIGTIGAARSSRGVERARSHGQWRAQLLLRCHLGNATHNTTTRGGVRSGGTRPQRRTARLNHTIINGALCTRCPGVLLLDVSNPKRKIQAEAAQANEL